MDDRIPRVWLTGAMVLAFIGFFAGKLLVDSRVLSTPSAPILLEMLCAHVWLMGCYVCSRRMKDDKKRLVVAKLCGLSFVAGFFVWRLLQH